MENQLLDRNFCCSSFESLLEYIMDSSYFKNKLFRVLIGIILLCLTVFEICILLEDIRAKFENFLNHSDYEILIIGSPTNSQSEGEYNDSYYQTIVKEGYERDCGKIDNPEGIVEVINSGVVSKILISFLSVYFIIVLIEILIDAIINIILPFYHPGESYDLKFTRGFMNYYLPFLKMLTTFIVGPIINISYGDCLGGPIAFYSKTFMYCWGIVYVVLNIFATSILIKKLKNKKWIFILLLINLPVTIFLLILFLIINILSKLKENPCFLCVCSIYGPYCLYFLIFLFCIYTILFILCVLLFLLGTLVLNVLFIKNLISGLLLLIPIAKMALFMIVALCKRCSKSNQRE